MCPPERRAAQTVYSSIRRYSNQDFRLMLSATKVLVDTATAPPMAPSVATDYSGTSLAPPSDV